MKKGLRFTLKDGSMDWYDPVEVDEIIETDEAYKFTNGGFTEYIIEKNDVEKLEYYDLCELCGCEMGEDGYCPRCDYNGF